MSKLRQTIAKRLVEAQQTTAMLTTFNEVDMSAIMNLRKRYQERFVKRYGTKVGFMSFFVKAVIEGLKEFPAINASIEDNEIIYKRYFHIGIAASPPKGLVVPVIRHADSMSFAEVELEIKRLGGLARDNKLKLENLQGGPFSITNGGISASNEDVRALSFYLQQDYAYYLKVQFTSARVTCADELTTLAGSMLDALYGEIMRVVPDWIEVRAGRYPPDNPSQVATAADDDA